jgi:hypothetical protein
MPSGPELLMKSMGIDVDGFKQYAVTMKTELDTRLTQFDQKLELIIRQNQTILNLLDKKAVELVPVDFDKVKVDPNEIEFEKLEKLAEVGHQHVQG